MNILPDSEPTTVPIDSSPQVGDTDEISLIDILKFFQRQFKVMAGITIAALLLGLGTGLSQTPQARRELLLKFTLPPELTVSPIGNESSSPINPLEIDDEVGIRDEIIAMGNLAFEQNLSFQQPPTALTAPVSASLSVVMEEQSERLQLVLSSPDAANLEAADQLALGILQDAADSVLKPYIIPEIARLDLVIQRTRAKITQLETLLATPTAISEDNNSAMLSSALQLPQQTVLAEELSKLIDYELARTDLSDLQTRQEPLIRFEVLMESQTQAASSLLQRLVLSAISGFMLSIFIALLVDQLPKIRAALAATDG